MGPAVSRPDDLCRRAGSRGKIAASMGPAVSRPDDARDRRIHALDYVLQWGRPFHGRMTTLPGGEPRGAAQLQWGRPFHGRMTGPVRRGALRLHPASMGPAVSRPDDSLKKRDEVSACTCFNGAGRFTAG